MIVDVKRSKRAKFESLTVRWLYKVCEVASDMTVAVYVRGNVEAGESMYEYVQLSCVDDASDAQCPCASCAMPTSLIPTIAELPISVPFLRIPKIES